MRRAEPIPSTSVSNANDPVPSESPVSAEVYRRRRITVGAIATVVVLVIAGLVAVIVGGGGDDTDDGIATEPATSAASTTGDDSTGDAVSTTTTVLPTSTASSTTTSTTTATTTTTTTTLPPPTTVLRNGVPIWEVYETKGPLADVAALTGQPADASVRTRPVVAVKIDNFARARPQWNLDQADVIVEENVEGVTRFIGLFHSILPDRVGPVRSARTGDLDVFVGLNRPVLGWSGGNRGVTNWIESAEGSNLLVNFSALRNPCYERSSRRSVPHNLLLDPTCAVNTALERDVPPGPARPLIPHDADYEASPDVGATPDESFTVEMDGVTVDWTWSPSTGFYLRFQNGNPHLAISGNQVAVQNVVELITEHPPSPVDARSPNPVTVGDGVAVIHRDGERIDATWVRPSPYAPFAFFDAATNEPIGLFPGKTFIHLARPR